MGKVAFFMIEEDLVQGSIHLSAVCVSRVVDIPECVIAGTGTKVPGRAEGQ